MNEVQQKLFKMLMWFHDYCIKNNIRYYIVGGTLLGACRHNGFIPWDDDIDIAIPRADYNKLITSFNKRIDNYILESPYSKMADYLFSYSKLYDTTTTLIEKSHYMMKRGLFIDIFPLDYIGNNTKEVKKNFKKFDKKHMLLSARTCAINKKRKWYKNIFIMVARLIPSFIIDNKELAIKLDKMAMSFGEKSKYIANLNGSYRDREIVDERFFGTPVLYEFEGAKVFGPQLYNEYLTNIYGNWRILPPENKRVAVHDYICLDLNKSYGENKI